MAFDPPTLTPEILRFAQRAAYMSSQHQILYEFSNCLEKYGFDFVFYKVKLSHRQESDLWGNITLDGAFRSNYSADPFFKYCCSTYAPTYVGADFLEDYPFLKDEEHAFVQSAAEAGFCSGLAVPVCIEGQPRVAGFNLGSKLRKEEFLQNVDEFRFKIALSCILVDRALQGLESDISPVDEIEPGEDQALTPRERDVLFLLSQGFSRKEMARMTNLSPHTIADYVKNLYAKLDVKNRSEATRKAIIMGLTPPRL